MAQYFPFQPSPVAPVQFLVTLDGAQYSAVITWNLFGNRWYLNLYDLNNNLQLAKAAVGSSQARPINLVAGYFQTSTLIYDVQNAQFLATP